jgi:ribosome-associated translation inhibitor RaiA
VEIHWRNLEGLASATRVGIEERLRRLDEGHGDLIKLWLTGATTAHHRHGAQEVSLRCQARGREIVAARTRPDLGQALDEVLDVFEREVRKLRERRSDDARAS